MQLKIDGVNIQLAQGNILYARGYQAMAIPASLGMGRGGGLAGMIHRAAGEELYQECLVKGGAHYPGQVIYTSGYRLTVPWVIHCFIPRNKKNPNSVRQLDQCYRNALITAERMELESICFSALATGTIGDRDAAHIALDALRGTAAKLRYVKKVGLYIATQDIWERTKELWNQHPESTFLNPAYQAVGSAGYR